MCCPQNTAFYVSRLFADKDDGAPVIAPCHVAYTDSERVIGDALRIPENAVFYASRSLLYQGDGVEIITNDQGKSYDFEFVAFTGTY